MATREKDDTTSSPESATGEAVPVAVIANEGASMGGRVPVPRR